MDAVERHHYMMLLDEAEQLLRRAVRLHDETGAVRLFRQVVAERTEAMHQRAQTAESRAYKAERDLVRFVHPQQNIDITNHHNALKCSYCNPKGLQFKE